MPGATATWVGVVVSAFLGGGAGIPFDELGEDDPDRSPAIGYFRPRLQFTWEYEASFGVLGRDGDAELTAMMALVIGWAP